MLPSPLQEELGKPRLENESYNVWRWRRQGIQPSLLDSTGDCHDMFPAA